MCKSVLWAGGSFDGYYLSSALVYSELFVKMYNKSPKEFQQELLPNDKCSFAEYKNMSALLTHFFKMK